MSVSRALTAPLRWVTWARRLRSDQWPALPRPTVSVGNLALGGRGKTPTVAALALLASAAGYRPAVLLRGHPRVGRAGPPCVVRRTSPGVVPWLAVLAEGGSRATASELAARVGDEAAWHAATTGLLVGVHPDRARAAAAIMERDPNVDLFLLDDSLQSPVRRDVDVVIIDPARDLEGGGAATRESAGSVPGGAIWVRLGTDLVREVSGLFTLRTGAPVDPLDCAAVTVAAGVGDPASVVSLAEGAGLRVGGTLFVRDHRAPPARALRAVVPPLVITEKDAVGWAMTQAPDDTLVLCQRLRGVPAVWARVRHALPAP